MSRTLAQISTNISWKLSYLLKALSKAFWGTDLVIHFDRQEGNAPILLFRWWLIPHGQKLANAAKRS